MSQELYINESRGEGLPYSVHERSSFDSIYMEIDTMRQFEKQPFAKVSKTGKYFLPTGENRWIFMRKETADCVSSEDIGENGIIEVQVFNNNSFMFGDYALGFSLCKLNSVFDNKNHTVLLKVSSKEPIDGLLIPSVGSKFKRLEISQTNLISVGPYFLFDRQNLTSVTVPKEIKIYETDRQRLGNILQ
jgi:hypothetical protein